MLYIARSVAYILLKMINCEELIILNIREGIRGREHEPHLTRRRCRALDGRRHGNWKSWELKLFLCH